MCNKSAINIATHVILLILATHLHYFEKYQKFKHICKGKKNQHALQQKMRLPAGGK